jgi:hypothetical protein
LIKSYFGDKTDNALQGLTELLMKVKDAEDVRVRLRELAG